MSFVLGTKRMCAPEMSPLLHVYMYFNIFNEFVVVKYSQNSFIVFRDGGGRSGLFCAVASLLEKVKVEREVSVVNAARRVKARRSNAIHCQVFIYVKYGPIFCII